MYIQFFQYFQIRRYLKSNMKRILEQFFKIVKTKLKVVFIVNICGVRKVIITACKRSCGKVMFPQASGWEGEWGRCITCIIG